MIAFPSPTRRAGRPGRESFEFAVTDERFDIVVRGATIFDGTGAPPFVADLAIRNDRIASVGKVEAGGGVEIDGMGMAVAPGFIDVHSHDDFAVLRSP